MTLAKMCLNYHLSWAFLFSTRRLETIIASGRCGDSHTGSLEEERTWRLCRDPWPGYGIFSLFHLRRKTEVALVLGLVRVYLWNASPAFKCGSPLLQCIHHEFCLEPLTVEL